MQRDPILASKVLPADPDHGQKHPHTFVVNGGLHYIKGNAAPYFSLTCTEHRQGFPNQEESGGADHDAILQHFPQFADLAALHLSDIDGAPMYAEGNGWYNLAGALGGFGEKYHAGNSKQNFPLPADKIDPAKPWQTTEHRYPTREECLQMFARHCRITLEEAEQIRGEVTKRVKKVNQFEEFSFVDPSPAEARARWAVICEAMHPRWKQEADACIIRHGLVLYGDYWDGQLPVGLHRVNDLGAPRQEPVAQEQTYTDRWGITSTATKVTSNPDFADASRDMSHWRVTLRHGKRKMTVYYSMGSLHAGRVPTAVEVIDCIAQDDTHGADFEEWARGLGLDPDNRSAHRTYTVCKRQAERLQKFLGAEHYAELTGGE